MHTDHLRIIQGFKHNTLSDFETRLMDLFYSASPFDIGKLSIIYPQHYIAFDILQLEKLEK